MKKITLVFLGLLILPFTTLKADVYFSPSLFYSSFKQKSGGSTNEDKLNIYNIKLGYAFTNNIYLGAVYDIEDLGTNTERKSLGVGVGYIQSGWNFHLNYYLSSEFTNGANKLEGDGLAIEIGYAYDLGAWAIGPSITHRIFNYDEQNGTSIPKITQTRTLPYVLLQFKF